MADITVYVTSDLTSSERKISPQWNLKHFKEKLELITGIAPQFQSVLLYTIPHSNEFTKIIDSRQYDPVRDENDTLTSFNIIPFSRLHVEDENPSSELKQLFDDTNNAEYTMPEDVYQDRSNSVLKWKQQNQLGRFNPAYAATKENQLQLDNDVITNMQLGDRCRTINIEGERRGTIKYIGKIPQLDQGEGNWVGVEFDEPVGKNNGLINGQTYFQCKPKYGSFLRPNKVDVGDYPELDIFDDDDDEI